jgi:ABC-type methionine transport system ATPase subunit
MTTARLHLTFPAHLISEPVIQRVGSEFRLSVNIRRANLEEDQGGWVILEVDGEEGEIGSAVAWLTRQGLQVERIDG